MSLTRRNVFLAAGGVLLLASMAALIWWWLHSHHWVERTIDLPPQGEAAYNPLYLLRQTLRADGVNAQSRRQLQFDQIQPGASDTIVLYGDPRQLSASESGQLLGWVRRGGHLIARLPPSHAASYNSGALLERLGVQLVPDRAHACHTVEMPADIPDMMLCVNAHFSLDSDVPLTALAGPEHGYAFARLAFGHGSVDVLSHLDFLNNTQLQRPERAAFALQLLAPNYAAGTVHLIYGEHIPPLWRWVLDHGRMALLPLLLALAAWLWLIIPRFGPPQSAPLPARRALLEHVDASGEYLYRHHRSDALLSALRETLWRWLHRHDPLTAAQDGDPQIAAIAAHSGLSKANVTDALNADLQGMRAGTFLLRAAHLMQMMQARR